MVELSVNIKAVDPLADVFFSAVNPSSHLTLGERTSFEASEKKLCVCVCVCCTADKKMKVIQIVY